MKTAPLPRRDRLRHILADLRMPGALEALDTILQGVDGGTLTAPDGRWQTTTFLAGLRVEGLIAPAVFDGPIDTASFTAWCAAEAVGARLCFLPKLQPRLESDRTVLCEAESDFAGRPLSLSVEALWHAIGQCIPRFSAAECRQYFRHCGYAASTVRS